MSTLSSNFATFVSGRSLQASSSAYFLPRSTFAAAALYFFPCFGIVSLPFFRTPSGASGPSRPGRAVWRSTTRCGPDCPPSPGLGLYVDAHRSRCSRDRAHRRLQVGGVEVRHLRRGNVLELLLRNLAHLGLVGLLRARPRLLLRREAGGLLDENRRGRRLRDERERAVREDGDVDRDRDVVLGLGLRARVELLAELHDVDAVLTQRRADRRRRVGLPGGNLELYESCDFFHVPVPTTSLPERNPARPGWRGRRSRR